MDFTEEQQNHIDGLIKAATEGLYTEEDLNRQVVAEVDRRVENGIQKGIETQKAKWEEEYKKKAKLSAEEIAKLELQDQIDKLEAERIRVNMKSNTVDAKSALNDAGVPKENYDKFIDLLVSDDLESTKCRVKDFIESFENTKKSIESDLRREMSNIPPPKGERSNVKGNAKTDFLTMAKEANIRK